MVRAFLGAFVYGHVRGSPIAVAALAVAGAGLAGIYVERLCFAPMGPGAGIASMVSSLAIWMQLEQAAILLLPRPTYPYPPLAAVSPPMLPSCMVRLVPLVT